MLKAKVAELVAAIVGPKGCRRIVAIGPKGPHTALPHWQHLNFHSLARVREDNLAG